MSKRTEQKAISIERVLRNEFPAKDVAVYVDGYSIVISWATADGDREYEYTGDCVPNKQIIEETRPLLG